MNNFLDKRFLLIAILVHFCFLFLFISFYSDGSIGKKFLVYGAHSKQKTEAYFKLLKSPSAARFLQLRRQEMAKKTKTKSLTGAKSQKKSSIQNKKKNVVVEKEMPGNKQQKKVVKKKEPEKKEKSIKSKETTEVDKRNQDKKEEKKELEQTSNEVEEEQQIHFDFTEEIDPLFIKYQGYVQQEIERTWMPPLGVPKGTECTILFIIEKDGSVKNFEFLKRSKMMIYDLSIVKVAKQFKFDSCLWGKTFKVDFRQ